jgi:hypothetical protein
MSDQKPEEVVPEYVNPSIGLSDVWKYSQLVGQLIVVFQGAASLPVGGETDFPMFSSWLPDGHEWELTLHGKKKR